VLALARQIGVLYERLAPVGALTMDHGPKVGETAPVFTLPKLGGGEIAIGAATGRSQLLFFLSPTCPVCKKLLPILRSLSQHERSTVDVVLASDGDPATHREFVRAHGLLDFPYVVSAPLGMSYQVSRLPFAALVDATGTLRARGLVNSREHLESLFEAQRLGVASLQEYFVAHGQYLLNPGDAGYDAAKAAFDPYDPLGLDDLLTPEDRAVRDTVRAWAADRVLPRVADWYERGELPVLEAGQADLLLTAGLRFGGDAIEDHRLLIGHEIDRRALIRREDLLAHVLLFGDRAELGRGEDEGLALIDRPAAGRRPCGGAGRHENRRGRRERKCASAHPSHVRTSPRGSVLGDSRRI